MTDCMSKANNRARDLRLGVRSSPPGVDLRALVATPAVRPFLGNHSDCPADAQFNDRPAELLTSEIHVVACIGSLCDRRRRVRSLCGIRQFWSRAAGARSAGLGLNRVGARYWVTWCRSATSTMHMAPPNRCVRHRSAPPVPCLRKRPHLWQIQSTLSQADDHS